MKRNRLLIYSMMFVLLFILPAFSFPQEEGSIQKKVAQPSDSVLVNEILVKFQNPELIFTDDRVIIEGLNLQLVNNLTNVIQEVSGSVTKLVDLQERRSVSSMDHLQRKTKYSIGQINKFILYDRKIEFGYAVITLVYIIALIIIYNTSYRRLGEAMLTRVLVTVLLYCCHLLIWRIASKLVAGADYTLFHKLIELSP